MSLILQKSTSSSGLTVLLVRFYLKFNNIMYSQLTLKVIQKFNCLFHNISSERIKMSLNWENSMQLQNKRKEKYEISTFIFTIHACYINKVIGKTVVSVKIKYIWFTINVYSTYGAC